MTSLLLTLANRTTSKIRSQITNAVADWNRFFWTPIDGTTLGIIRFLTGTMLLYNLMVWTLRLEEFFSHNGLQPLNAIRSFYANTYAYSFWFVVPEEYLWPVHWCCLGVVFLFCVGCLTRVTSILAFVITISYSQRVPIANFGLDQILGMLCLYCALGPSGLCLSVDSWLKRRQGLSAQDKRSSQACVAIRLIQIHMCVIYFWAGMAKLKGESWWTGDAMWRVMANQEYQTADLTWTAWVPWLPYVVAHVTVLWEIFFCVLIWQKRLRPLLLLIGTGMHFGIGYFLGMWTFGLIMTYAYFAFSDPVAWKRRFQWISNLPETLRAR